MYELLCCSQLPGNVDMNPAGILCLNLGTVDPYEHPAQFLESQLLSSSAISSYSVSFVFSESKLLKTDATSVICI